MPVTLDTYLGVHAQALKLRSQRTEVLAANIANADTPGYRARDVDFKAALAAASGPNTPMHLATTANRHIGGVNISGNAQRNSAKQMVKAFLEPLQHAAQTVSEMVARRG